MKRRTIGVTSVLLALALLTIVVAYVDHRTRYQQAAIRSIHAVGGEAFDQQGNQISDSYFDSLSHTLGRFAVPNIRLDSAFVASLQGLPSLKSIRIRGGDFQEVDMPTVALIRHELPQVQIDNGYVDLCDAMAASRSN